jgi:aspartyl protease family protein
LAPSTNLLALLCLLTISTLLTDCTGCSRTSERGTRSGRGQQQSTTIPEQDNPAQTGTPRTTTVEIDENGPTEIPLEENEGVYMMPATINGVPMTFILDTGASLVSMSEIEAGFLYKQGTIGEEDIVEKAQFSDANGDISEGTIINLRSVRVGNRTLYNVRASVVSGTKAPLLLGQSVLAQFGRVSLDYARKTVSFD